MAVNLRLIFKRAERDPLLAERLQNAMDLYDKEIGASRPQEPAVSPEELRAAAGRDEARSRRGMEDALRNWRAT